MSCGSRCNFLFKTEAMSDTLTSIKVRATTASNSVYQRLHSSSVIKRHSTIIPVSQQNHGQGYSFPNHPARVPQVRLGQQRAPQPETEAKGEMTKAFCLIAMSAQISKCNKCLWYRGKQVGQQRRGVQGEHCQNPVTADPVDHLSLGREHLQMCQSYSCDRDLSLKNIQQLICKYLGENLLRNSELSAASLLKIEFC